MKNKFLLMIAVVFFLTPSFNLKAELRRVHFLHTNDIHDRLCGAASGYEQELNGGMVRMASYIKRRILELGDLYKPIVSDGGDLFEGGAKISENSFGKVTDQAFHLIPYDIRVLGDHEIEFKYYDDPEEKPLKRTINQSFKKNITMVGSNFYMESNGKKRYPIGNDFPFNKNGKIKMREYSIIERNGVRIGFFGITEPGLSNNEFGTADQEETFKLANQTVKKLKEIEKVHLVVALTHLGLETGDSSDEDKLRDTVLMENVPGIHLILGGNSHHISGGTSLKKYKWITDIDEHTPGINYKFDPKKMPKEFPNGSKKTVYVQAGKGATHVADFWIEVETQPVDKELNPIINYGGEIVSVSQEFNDLDLMTLFKDCQSQDYFYEGDD
jgi:2',3'-cyclic-nucleotide 2'-phosphodiesterase (5'-nucleotidase family)